MVPLHGRAGPLGGPRGAHGAAQRGEPVAGFRDAAGAGGGGGEDGRLLQELAQRQGEPRQAAAFPVERQDALRQDLCRLPACQADGLAQGAGADLQAGGAERVGGGPEGPRGFQGLAVHFSRRPVLRGCGQEAAVRLLRVVSGLSGQESEHRRHQGQERVGPFNELGLCDSGRIPLRRLAGEREGAVRGRGQEGGRVRRRRGHRDL
ncbi:MAG: hypothetical protein BWY57_02768 [Betaproteobacteria bacterium ADurb.Bin341]|nr:MAG: hypothetical protein BWY57_02768 [Betaproteobacteria bacterium ADurb.Bin341]